MADDFPKLRPLEVFPIQVEGQRMVALRDPLGYAEQTCCAPLKQFFLMTLFDGEHSIVDIQAAYMRQFGELLLSDDVRRLIDELDERLLLDSPRFREFKRREHEAFLASPVRPARSAGSAYPASPEEIRAQLDAYLRAAAPAPDASPPRGLIAPHIDYHRGGAGYGRAYAALRNAEARLFVVIGVAHAPAETPFIATTKSFQTPLGVARTDAAFVRRLAERSGLDLFQDEYLHKNEHSVEFQALFLQHLFGDEFRFAPLLCSAFESFTGPDEVPSDSEPLNALFAALRGLIAEAEEPVCLIAGADLAHVGPQFGDAEKLSDPFLQKVEAQDREMLDYVVARDAAGFYRQVMRDDNARRVCGLSAIYTLLAAGEFEEARLTHYEQAVDEERVCGVSFASVVFS